MNFPASLVKRGEKLFRIAFSGQYVSDKPVGEIAPILFGRLPKSQESTHIGPMLLDSATVPGVLLKTLRCDTDLLRDVGDHGAGDIAFVLGKAPFVQEALEQDSKAQTRWFCLVGE